MKHSGTYFVVSAFVALSIMTVLSPSVALAGNIRLVPLKGQLIASNAEPGLANGGFDRDIQQLNAESDQSQPLVDNRGAEAVSEKAGTVGDQDGLTVKLIRLNKIR